MDDLLKFYVLDQENPSLNFELARCYHDNLDYSSAVSFYLRAKERTSDVEMQNKCIEYLIDCSKKLEKGYLVSELEKYYNDVTKNSKIVDCFPFFYEKELLELRVNLLKDYVDEFIVCEMNRTHSGSEKEFIARDAIKELGLPEDKIRVIEICIPDDDEIKADEGDIFHANDAKSSKPKNSTRERLQRDSVMSVLDEYSDDTIFILSDCDEIINPKFIPYFSEGIRKSTNNIIKVPLVSLEGRADTIIYDGDKPLSWRYSMVICTKKQLSNGGSPTIFRGNFRNPFPPIWLDVESECGWHFTFMGSKEIRKYKAESCAHSDNLNVYYSLTSNTLEEIGGTIKNENISVRDYSWSLLPREIFESKRVFDYLLPPK